MCAAGGGPTSAGLLFETNASAAHDDCDGRGRQTHCLVETLCVRHDRRPVGRSNSNRSRRKDRSPIYGNRRDQALVAGTRVRLHPTGGGARRRLPPQFRRVRRRVRSVERRSNRDPSRGNRMTAIPVGAGPSMFALTPEPSAQPAPSGLLEMHASWFSARRHRLRTVAQRLAESVSGNDAVRMHGRRSSRVLEEVTRPLSPPVRGR